MILVAEVSNEEKVRILELIFECLLENWQIAVIAIAAAYVYATWWYFRRSREADDKIQLAPISVKGGISEKLGAREVGLLLRTQLDAIKETFRKATGSNVSDFAAEAVAADFPSMNAALVDAPLEIVSSELTVKEEIVITIGPVKIPVGAFLNLFLALLRVLPVPFRRHYLASLLHISIVSVDNETQLIVYRKEPRFFLRESFKPKVMEPSTSHPMLLARTTEINGLKEFNDLLRDTAFMLLQLHGGFEERKWQGMRCFTDGLETLDNYRQTTKDELLKAAKESFGRSVAADSENHEAAYFYGYMLLFERSRESIAKAIRLFQRADETENKKLKALANTGLAHCYAQQYHRLAKREADILGKACDHAKKASLQWREVTGEQTLHPLILYTLALSKIADEGEGRKDKEVKQRFGDSANELLKAIELEPDNAMFYNTLGWLYLKLAEKEDVKDDGISPKLKGSPTERAEYYIRIALDLNPQNKLSHANLCLLYATPRYLAEKEEKKREEYLIRCRYHGLKAIQLDPQYINGHRDLALSLIRYGEFDEAEEYFKKALRFAAVVDKDLEIIENTIKVLKEHKAADKWLKLFGHPNAELLEPPEGVSWS